ncbi:MAG: HAD family hydrolase [Anaerolineaceae bacterium]|jgi:phosphoglycolate phosphatase-like HAD superfamily hydrolase
MALSAVLFDLDGTLADTMDVCVEAYQFTLQTYLDRWVPQEIIAAEFGRSEEGILQTFLPAVEQHERLNEYLHHYRRLHQRLDEPFPGIPALLEMLQQRGVRIAIVTGKGQHSAAISMAALGLAPYIERLEYGHAEYNNKSENIRRVLADWGIEPAVVAYAGDMISDMHHASQAGVLPLGAAWSRTATVHENDGAEHVFHSVNDLHEWLERATQR